MNKWADFYKERVNSGYQKYFNLKYNELMMEVVNNYSTNKTKILEEGIGIGSLAKGLIREGFTKYTGMDNSQQMINLAIENNYNGVVLNVFKMDMFSDNIDEIEEKYNLILTHGVLEHFTDSQLDTLNYRWGELKIPNIHYVPSNKYPCPSFGDERLMSREDWENRFPDHIVAEFNGGYDLLLIKHNNGRRNKRG